MLVAAAESAARSTVRRSPSAPLMESLGTACMYVALVRQYENEKASARVPSLGWNACGRLCPVSALQRWSRRNHMKIDVDLLIVVIAILVPAGNPRFNPLPAPISPLPH
jgi:hypothetical protein